MKKDILNHLSELYCGLVRVVVGIEPVESIKKCNIARFDFVASSISLQIILPFKVCIQECPLSCIV